MIVSMTGFGDATVQKDGTHYAVEIRSLNNRYFKPTIKLPENISGLEPETGIDAARKAGAWFDHLHFENAAGQRRGRVSHQRCRPSMPIFSPAAVEVKGLDGIVKHRSGQPG